MLLLKLCRLRPRLTLLLIQMVAIRRQTLLLLIDLRLMVLLGPRLVLFLLRLLILLLFGFVWPSCDAAYVGTLSPSSATAPMPATTTRSKILTLMTNLNCIIRCVEAGPWTRAGRRGGVRPRLPTIGVHGSASVQLRTSVSGQRRIRRALAQPQAQRRGLVFPAKSRRRGNRGPPARLDSVAPAGSLHWRQSSRLQAVARAALARHRDVECLTSLSRTWSWRGTPHVLVC